MIANVANLARNGARKASADNPLAAAMHVAVQRMEFLYSQAMEAWRSSQEIPTASGGKSFGQPRYLAIAMRINMAMLEMQTRHDASQQLLRARLAKLQPRQEADTAADPPVRDCSPLRGDCQDSACDEAESLDASDYDEEGYEDHAEPRRQLPATQNASSAPVHPALDAPDDTLADLPPKRELFPRKLNRHERRARQRQLDKIRRKKIK